MPYSLEAAHTSGLFLEFHCEYSREDTASIDLAALLPKDCGTATYGTSAASGNETYNAAPVVNGGKLSYTLNSGNINDGGTITVTVATQNYFILNSVVEEMTYKGLCDKIFMIDKEPTRNI